MMTLEYLSVRRDGQSDLFLWPESSEMAMMEMLLRDLRNDHLVVISPVGMSQRAAIPIIGTVR